MDPSRSNSTITQSRTQAPSFNTTESALSTNKVLRNTYMLLSITLLFSAAMAGVGMMMNLPYGAGLVCSLVSIGLVWFVLPRTANSVSGIYVVFAFTGLLGLGLGPVINHYVSGYSNGAQIVMMALGLTGATFIGLSAYVIKSKRDFSFLGSFVASGMIVMIVLMVGSLIASLMGFYFEPLMLGISAAVTLLMCGLILHETSDIIQGGQTNYILATAMLYLSIYNLFTSLLHLLGFAAGDD